jgi:hypothetical protein
MKRAHDATIAKDHTSWQYRSSNDIIDAKINLFSTWHKQVDYRGDQDQIGRNSTSPTSDLTCLVRNKCGIQVSRPFIQRMCRSYRKFLMLLKVLPMTIISFKLKLFAGRKGVPPSFFLLISSFLRDQKRRAQARAVAVAHIAASLDIILTVKSRLGDSNRNQIIL